jgi:hypothetical protein
MSPFEFRILALSSSLENESLFYGLSIFRSLPSVLARFRFIRYHGCYIDTCRLFRFIYLYWECN